MKYAGVIKRKINKSLAAIGALVLVMQLVLPATVFGAQAAADLDQCRNGGSSIPNDCLDLGSGEGWFNGNAGSSNSHYLEGYSIPYRLVLTNLIVGPHTATIEWDIKHSNKHAIDFITYYNRLQPHGIFGHPAETINPIDGVAGSFGFPSTFSIPAPSSAGSPVTNQPTNTFNGLPAGEKLMTIWNGTISNLSYVSQGSLTANQSESSIKIDFNASSATVVIAWGGHIATPVTWGGGNSAGGISGSPYHTRLIDLDGSGGNQDRSLSAGAVLVGELVVVKQVINDNGGTKVASDFTINVSGVNANPSSFPGSTVGTPVQLDPGSYSVSETPPAGYSVSFSADCSGTIVAGEQKVCTVTNDDNPPTTGQLTVIKHVINDNGGSTQASAFTVHVKSSGNDVAGSPAAGSETGMVYTLPAGTYTVSENTPPSGYAQTSIICDGNQTNTVTLGIGDQKTCTITNNDQLATLVVKKHVINNDNGTNVASDFTMQVTGTNVSSSSFPGDETGTSVTLNAGSYSVDEANSLGYVKSLGADCSGTIGNGQTKTCTITNDDPTPPPPQKGNLVVIKHVMNDNGGTGVASDFSLHVKSNNLDVTGSSPAAGSATGTTYFLDPGSYVVSEDTPPSGYIQTGFGGDCDQNGNITVFVDQTVTCTITNDDIAPILTVKKHVVNDNGGTKVASDFSISVTDSSPSPATFPGDEAGTTVTLNAGSYSVDENAVTGYAKTLGANCSGSISLAETKTCTIINDDQSATLIVKKHVINDDQTGTKSADDFTINVTGGNSTPASFAGDESGTSVTLDAGSYSADENSITGYTKTLNADCSGTIANGQTKTCKITNDDVAAAPPPPAPPPPPPPPSGGGPTYSAGLIFQSVAQKTVGGSFNESVTIKNTGGGSLAAGVLEITFPAELIMISNSPASATYSGSVVTWNIPVISAGDSFTVSFTVQPSTTGASLISTAKYSIAGNQIALTTTSEDVGAVAGAAIVAPPPQVGGTQTLPRTGIDFSNLVFLFLILISPLGFRFQPKRVRARY